MERLSRLAIGVVALALAVAHVLGLASTGTKKPRVLDRLREQPVVVASVVGVAVPGTKLSQTSGRFRC